MLVLSRKEGERIVIGDNITLVISKVNGNRVTIGIEAPRDVKIVRGELEVAATSAELETRPLAAPATTLREFASNLLPLHRQVG